MAAFALTRNASESGRGRFVCEWHGVRAYPLSSYRVQRSRLQTGGKRRETREARKSCATALAVYWALAGASMQDVYTMKNTKPLPTWNLANVLGLRLGLLSFLHTVVFREHARRTTEEEPR
jgi:hypothetical protein